MAVLLNFETIIRDVNYTTHELFCQVHLIVQALLTTSNIVLKHQQLVTERVGSAILDSPL